MAKTKRMTLYGTKTNGRGAPGSFFITREAYKLLRAAKRRSGASLSDVIEFCIRLASGELTRERAKAISEASSISSRRPAVAETRRTDPRTAG